MENVGILVYKYKLFYTFQVPFMQICLKSNYQVNIAVCLEQHKVCSKKLLRNEQRRPYTMQ